MKILLFNCHGHQEINPSFFSVPINKNVTFLSKEGKTLSVDQVTEFIDAVLTQTSLNQAIQVSTSVEVDTPLTPKQILDKYSSLKADKKNITSEVLQKIIQLQIDKIEDFLLQTFTSHNDITFIAPELTLKHDDVANGVVSLINSYLTKKQFTSIGITIYGDNNAIDYDQLYLMCDIKQLINDGKANVVYITPSQSIAPLSLSIYLQRFSNAYLIYDKVKSNLLEAFLDLTTTNTALNNANQYVQNNNDCSIYNFGQDNSDVVIGACREFSNFDFGHQI
jgi:hypothetical protein